MLKTTHLIQDAIHNSIINYTKNYFNFSDCTIRLHFLVSLVVVLSFLCALLEMSIVIALIWLALNVIPILAINARRFHDAGMSGWWQCTVIMLIIAAIKPSKLKHNKYRHVTYRTLWNHS